LGELLRSEEVRGNCGALEVRQFAGSSLRVIWKFSGGRNVLFCPIAIVQLSAG
jgi:hypothetical protein